MNGLFGLAHRKRCIGSNARGNLQGLIEQLFSSKHFVYKPPLPSLISTESTCLQYQLLGPALTDRPRQGLSTTGTRDNAETGFSHRKACIF